MADIFAADRVVSLTAGVGTDLTIQDAVNNLPAKGGKISIKHGTFPISSAIVLPDKNIIHDNTGYLSGGGPTIIGASTLVHDNLP